MGLMVPLPPVPMRNIDIDEHLRERSEGKMIPLICTQCGGQMETKYECKWCGTKYREEGKIEAIWQGGLAIRNSGIPVSNEWLTGPAGEVGPVGEEGYRFTGPTGCQGDFKTLNDRVHIEEELEETRAVVKGLYKLALLGCIVVVIIVGSIDIMKLI